MIPDEYGNDEAFLFATEIEHEISRNMWTIRVDPDSCLVGPAVDHDIKTIRDSNHDSTKTATGSRYNGRLLFSAGVVLLLNGQLVLLRRGANAPSDPGKWQSPAGRCDGPPGETALSELYEELVVLEGGCPVFVTHGERSKSFEPTYESALRRINHYVEPSKWNRYLGKRPLPAKDLFATVKLEYGAQSYTDKMVAFFDEDTSTLELRYVLETEVATPSTLKCVDSEFGRTVEMFAPSTVGKMNNKLVPTDAYLADTLYHNIC